MPLKIIRNDIAKANTEAIVNIAKSRCDMGEAVSPLYEDGTAGEEKLRACYKNALNLAADNDIKSISIPLIAIEGLDYPKADLLRVAIDEINAFLPNHEMDVNLVVCDSTYTAMAQELYPQLEAFIDHNYVPENHEDEYDTHKSLFHRLDALVKPGASGKVGRRLSRSEESCASVPFLGSPVSEGFADVLADRSVRDYEGSAVFNVDADYPEAELNEGELEDSPLLRERLLHIEDTFGEYLFYLIDTKGYSSIEVQNRAWITKSVYSKIKTTKKEYKPSKRIALQLCIGLMLNIDESIDILGRAGYAFSPCDKQDLIFRFFIENKCYDIIGVSDALEKYGVDPIVGF